MEPTWATDSSPSLEAIGIAMREAIGIALSEAIGIAICEVIGIALREAISGTIGIAMDEFGLAMSKSIGMAMNEAIGMALSEAMGMAMSETMVPRYETRIWGRLASPASQCFRNSHTSERQYGTASARRSRKRLRPCSSAATVARACPPR